MGIYYINIIHKYLINWILSLVLIFLINIVIYYIDIVNSYLIVFYLVLKIIFAIFEDAHSRTDLDIYVNVSLYTSQSVTNL